MLIRNIESEDFEKITPILRDWWGGRDMSLPKLFFDHFQNTSFVMEDNNKIIGFLIGFLSQSQDGEAYIHFVGIEPTFRNKGIANSLYNLFFEEVQKQNVHKIKCITSIVNKKSIAFHTRMGFDIVPGDNLIDGISVHSDHGGEGVDRVLFFKEIK
ncbi:GNAT family N-acetyltransferase [Paraliobacillus sediminis]|uniref:GNAT family N-acetyltransferase n=1 Tax=Paraliobacillus sediminis TaxID=1885916 RepID=UPI000E3B6B38|nr:GNAT family N-acetyltransferase [Paraliobacillus sediminis]